MHVQKGAKDSTCPAARGAQSLIRLNAVGAFKHERHPSSTSQLEQPVFWEGQLLVGTHFPVLSNPQPFTQTHLLSLSFS